MAEFAKVRAIYFDLDDTLCAYWDAAKAGLRAAFDQHPIPGRTTEQAIEDWSAEFPGYAKSLKQTHWYQRYCVSGEPTRTELMRLALSRSDNESEEHADRLSGSYLKERHAALSLFPESREVLDALQGRFFLGLITNGPADTQRAEVEVLGLEDYFQAILIEGEMQMGKPNPAVMRKAEELSGSQGAEVLMVGNSYKHDILPAIAAGWRTAWVRRPSDVAPSSKTGKPEERPEDGPEPDLTITNLRSLLEALPES